MTTSVVMSICPWDETALRQSEEGLALIEEIGRYGFREKVVEDTFGAPAVSFFDPDSEFGLDALGSRDDPATGVERLRSLVAVATNLGL